MGFKSVPMVVGFIESNVNMKNTGATLIFSNPNSNGSYFPTKVRIYGGNLSGIVSPPTFSIGTNASNYNNILGSTAATGLLANTYIDYPVTSPASIITHDTEIYVNVTIGANATTFGCRLALFMDYF